MAFRMNHTAIVVPYAHERLHSEHVGFESRIAAPSFGLPCHGSTILLWRATMSKAEGSLVVPKAMRLSSC
jgi:hypothetical protein